MGPRREDMAQRGWSRKLPFRAWALRTTNQRGARRWIALGQRGGELRRIRIVAGYRQLCGIGRLSLRAPGRLGGLVRYRGELRAGSMDGQAIVRSCGQAWRIGQQSRGAGGVARNGSPRCSFCKIGEDGAEHRCAPHVLGVRRAKEVVEAWCQDGRGAGHELIRE